MNCRTLPLSSVQEFIMVSRLVALAGVFSLAAFVTAAGAAGPNPNRGKTLFKNGCKACHVKDGGAKELTPLSKTQSQWTRTFKGDMAPMIKRVQAKTGQALTPGDLTDIQAFLVSHAADSDQPETCGK
jgi:cytochrome c5